MIDSPFTVNLPGGSTLQVVRGDVETGIIQPEFAIWTNGNVTTGPMLIRDNVHHLIDNSIDPASFPGIDAGSRWDQEYSVAMTGTGLVNPIVSGLPNYTQVSAVEMTNVTAITGVTGSASVQILDAAAGPLLKTAINGAVLTNGAVNRGATPDAPAFGAFSGRVSYVSSSGNPTGTVSARVTLTKLCRG